MENTPAKSKLYQPIPLEVEEIGEKVLDAAYTVHSALGPGLLESVYEACLAYEIRKLGLKAETQVVVPVITYLKTTGCRLGYLMNFNVQHFRDGFSRKVH